jgi:hypothetical protein
VRVCALPSARWRETYRHSELYTVTGILPNTGFVSEAFQRLGHTLLPEVLDPACCAASCARPSTAQRPALGGRRR